MKEYRHISVRVKPQEYEQFKAIVKDRDLTVSQEIRHYIRLRIEQADALNRKTRTS